MMIKMSMLSFVMSAAKSELALALEEFTFLSEKTFRTPIVGRRVQVS